MKFGVLAGGTDDPETGSPWNEDPLECYRREVEQRLRDELVLLEEEALDRFYDHVIASFDDEVPAGQCARTWRLLSTQ
jgi:hypothetical protein